MKIFECEQPKNAVRDPSLLWPGGVVYYAINRADYSQSILLCYLLILTNYICIDLAAEELATLQDAFDKYLNYTCITFEERTDQVNYVSIKKTGGG